MQQRKDNAAVLGHSSDEYCKHIDRLAVRSHAEVAQILGITPETSRQLERSALAKLRKALCKYVPATEMFEDDITNNDNPLHSYETV